MHDYESIQLPEEETLWDKLQKVDNLTLKEIEENKKFLFETSNLFQRVVDSFSSEGEAIEDSAIIATTYERYRIYAGGLIGLVKATERKLKGLVYKKLLVDNAATTKREEKTTQGDREIFMREAVASLEGLLLRLESLDDTLKSRSYRVKTK